jgi:hypothetical protein
MYTMHNNTETSKYMLLRKMYLSIKVLFRAETMEAYKIWGGETKKTNKAR